MEERGGAVEDCGSVEERRFSAALGTGRILGFSPVVVFDRGGDETVHSG